MKITDEELLQHQAGIMANGEPFYTVTAKYLLALISELRQRRSLDRMDAEAFEEFQRRLDNPPKPNKALIELMGRKPVWER
jgi:uncharacterized protein (DUF1778 family)